MGESTTAPGPALRPQAPRGSYSWSWRIQPFELTALPERRGTAAGCLEQALPPACARRRQAGGCRGPHGGAERPAPTSRPHARRPPLSFLTSRSALAARRNWGLCFFMIFRKVLRGAVRFILLLLPLRPLPPRAGPTAPAQPPSAVRIRRPGAGARPPAVTHFPTAARGATPEERGAERRPPPPSRCRRRGSGANAFPWKPRETVVTRGEPHGASVPSGRAAADKAEGERGAVPPAAAASAPPCPPPGAASAVPARGSPEGRALAAAAGGQRL